jgi:hypothetical protein
MMGGGMLLRRTPLVDYWWGRTFLGILYVAVGTALLVADIVFWRAVVRSLRASHEDREPERAGDAAGSASCETSASADRSPAA